jgi:hypothetical protein
MMPVRQSILIRPPYCPGSPHRALGGIQWKPIGASTRAAVILVTGDEMKGKSPLSRMLCLGEVGKLPTNSDGDWLQLSIGVPPELEQVGVGGGCFGVHSFLLVKLA